MCAVTTHRVLEAAADGRGLLGDERALLRGRLARAHQLDQLPAVRNTYEGRGRGRGVSASAGRQGCQIFPFPPFFVTTLGERSRGGGNNNKQRLLPEAARHGGGSWSNRAAAGLVC